METLLIHYFLPLLVLAALVFLIIWRFRQKGGPALLFAVFFLVALGPSLIYALATDDSSALLFLVSILVALALTGLLALLFFVKKK